MGYADAAARPRAADGSRERAGHRTRSTPSCTTTARRPSSTRRILDHLLHQTFAGEAGEAEPESDLILDPNPDPETIRAVLGRYPFRDVQGAYQNLTQLAQESVPFLSTRRCRHFLASIAPQPAPRRRRDARPGHGPGQPGKGDRLARGQGGAVGAVQLQPAEPEALRRSVRLEPVPVGDPHQQPRHDRRAARQPGAQPAARRRGAARRSWPSCAAGPPTWSRSCTASRTRNCCASASATSSARTPIRETTAALSDLAETILVQVAALQ